MHIPDGFISAPVAAAAAVLAAGGVAVCLRGARRDLDERVAPLAGMVAVFIFAGQMINFPVAAGTSGHLIGAALAAILIGPYAGALALTVVLVVQALLFADGGLLALGLNVLNLAIVAPVVAYAAFRALVAVLPASRGWWMLSAAVAGWSSVVAAAGAFSVEFALGGTTALDPLAVSIAMVSVHAVIGVAEGIITALVVGAVLLVRTDLVAGVADRLPQPVLDGPARNTVGDRGSAP